MIRPVILCGGAGTRLWPVSRQLLPKQFLALVGDETLLQQTALRVTGEAFAPPIIVSAENQCLFIEEQLQQVGSAPDAILLEPAPRNTAAAAAVAAAWVRSMGDDELLLLMPSDHIIMDREAFLEAVRIGTPHAEAGSIVTFGARPTEPNTQYGYIEAEAASSGEGAFPIARFVEKPDAEQAARYLATGRFYWNAGIFLVKASTLLEEMQQFLPESVDAISTAVANAATAGILVRPEREAFRQAENISIDHGIMERTKRGIVVPVQMNWSDVGSWDAVWKLGQKDADGNAIQGDVVTADTRKCLLRSLEGGPLIATIGLDQVAVIAVADAVFVCPIDRVSEVKNLVEVLKAQGRDCVVSPSKLR